MPAVGLTGVIVMMVLPVPPFLLDLTLVMSIALSLTILIVSLYVKEPLDFSVFPSVLLFTTLFRLSLNVASTRLILLRGEEGMAAAGHVIEAFGQFVVAGNYAVGFIVFVILVIINFVVITKGATRIAEVAARFTLDAMPGKQMAIDADLNAGLINEAEARQRRQRIQTGSRLLRRHGRRVQVRARRRHCRLDYSRDQSFRRFFRRRDAEGHDSGGRGATVQPAERRRWSGQPNPGADRFHRRRHGGDAHVVGR